VIVVAVMSLMDLKEVQLVPSWNGSSCIVGTSWFCCSNCAMTIEGGVDDYRYL